MQARSRRWTDESAVGVAVGVAIAAVTLLVSRLAGVPSPTVLAGLVALAWLAAVGLVVARSVVAVTHDDETDTGRFASIGYAEDGSGDDAPESEGRREIDSRLTATPDVPAWLESDETPWNDERGDERADRDTSDGDVDVERNEAEP